MKLIIAALSCAFAISAFAESPPSDKRNFCRGIGLAFQQAAYYRDRGSNPELAFAAIKDSISASKGTSEGGLTKEVIKLVVNTVYFDRDFANAGGNSLAYKIEGNCLSDGKPQFQPLK